MINPPNFAAIAALDLGRIIAKLCHIESGEGWSRARADAAVLEYRRFLYLMKTFPTEQTVPSVEVDTVWHYHILDTVHYAADCATVFGYFLHHDPVVGLDGDSASEALERASRAGRMDTLYAATFGNAPASRAAGAYCGRTGVGAPVTEAAYCGRTGVGAPATEAAYCGRTGVGAPVTEAAYCGRTGVGAPVTTAAYCGRTGVGAPVTEAAYCGRTGVGISYCGSATAAPAAIA